MLLLALSAACTDRPAPEPREGGADLETEVEDYLTTVDPDGQVSAVLVRHQDEVVLERYVGAEPADYWDLQSVTKSIVSALVGIAIGSGAIDSVDQTLGELLPAGSRMSPDVAALTLRELLTHTAGLPPPGAPGADYFLRGDWVRAILGDRSAEGAADGSFAYSNAGAHLVAAVLEEATGRSVLDYARENLFDPLGIPSRPAFEQSIDVESQAELERLYAPYYEADFTWPVDPQGLHDGACCLKLRPQDLDSIGRLFLDGGQWDGEQVVPADWVQESTTSQVELSGPDDGYGYLWWTTTADDEPAYYAFGSGGQLIEVVPSRDLVVVVVTELDRRDPMSETKTFGQDSATDLVDLVIAGHFAR